MVSAGIIGLGLIGGSIAKALKSKTDIKTVKAYNLNTASLVQAKEDGVIDEYSTNDLSIFSDCDIVFICVHTSQIPEYIEKLRGIVKKDCIVTDVGSTKKSVIAKAEEFADIRFVGGHPMTGSEKGGYSSSSDIAFENAYYIIVPTKHTDERTISEFSALLEQILAIPVVLTSETHDKTTAAISHAPHLIAAALANMARRFDDGNDTMKALAAGGFRDITRIASSDSRLWQSIAYENRADILSVIDTFQSELDEVKKYLKNGDETELGGYLRLAKNYRDSLPQSGGSKFVKTHELFTDIADKPGSIAIVATLLGVGGVNIKNIGIVNNREFQGGVLQISFGSEADMKKGAELLEDMNFKVILS